MENLGLAEGPCSSCWSPALAVIWVISLLDLFGFWANFLFFSLLDQAVLSILPGEQ